MKGIIYKITCNDTDEVYYGSTQQSLKKRMSEHQKDYKRWKEGKTDYNTSFHILDRDNYSYVLIETIECEDRKRLERKERYYIENHSCINKIIVGRTKKEYREANQEKINECKRAYYTANKEKERARIKAYREANKDLLNERRRQLYADKKQLKEKN